MKPAGESEERGGNEGREETKREEGGRVCQTKRTHRIDWRCFMAAHSVYVTMTLFDICTETQLVPFFKNISPKRESENNYISIIQRYQIPCIMAHSLPLK